MSYFMDHLVSGCLLVVGIVLLLIGVVILLSRPAAADFTQTEAIFSNMRINSAGTTTPFVTFTVNGKTVEHACQPVQDSKLNAKLGDQVKISYKCSSTLLGTSWLVLWGDGDQTVENAASPYRVIGWILAAVGVLMLLGGILLMSKGY